MKTLVFCLEEPSAKEMLMGLLPRIIPADVDPKFIVFNGKQDMEKQLPNKLNGWRKPDTGFVILEDQDRLECKVVKERLQQICRNSGRNNTLVRIACRELESFYLGDLKAVEKGLKIKKFAEKYQMSARFRVPDAIINPSKTLYELTDKQYQKISGSRAIAPHLSIDENRSASFNTLVSGIVTIIQRLDI